MGAPTVICNICNQEVTKRSTLAHQGGRACKSHSEAQESKEAKELAEIKERERIEADKERRRKDIAERNRIPTGPECLCCHAPGIHAREHWLKMWVATKKVQAEGKNCILDKEALSLAYGKKMPVLVGLKIKDQFDGLVRNCRDGQMFWSMLGGLMFVCYDCAKKHGYANLYEKTLAPEISPEQLKDAMAIGALIDDGLKNMIKDIVKEIDDKIETRSQETL